MYVGVWVCVGEERRKCELKIVNIHIMYPHIFIHTKVDPVPAGLEEGMDAPEVG